MKTQTWSQYWWSWIVTPRPIQDPIELKKSTEIIQNKVMKATRKTKYDSVITELKIVLQKRNATL
jgi:hypothetical protein